jgi:uncharacterized protein YndB with AHSA1/START domain
MKLDLRIDEVLPSPIEAVWRALTDPRTLARWLMENDFEPRVGHAFTLRDPPTATWDGRVACEVLELDPPRRMVWSWNGGMKGETTTRVVFELRAEGEGTRFTLRHEGEGDAAQGEALLSGWKRKAGVLRRVLGPDYACRVAFARDRERVFDAIATLEGLGGWWTPLVCGSAAEGQEMRFDFEGMDEHIRMRVDRLERPKSVAWTCIAHSSLDDWAGTKITFDLVPRGKEGTELHFRHVGLEPDLECYESCEAGWDHFLRSLARYVDQGRGTPFRGDR